MGKPYFLLLLFVLVCGPASAQVAVGGTSENSDKVFWLTWDGDLDEKEYTWYFSSEVRIVAQVDDIEEHYGYNNWGGDPTIEPYTPGTWKGDGLGEMYSGEGGIKDHDDGSRSVLGVENSGLVTQEGKRVRFDIDLQLEFKVEGEWKNVVYPGMVIADAEELNGSTEFISANTNNSTAWQLIDKRVGDTPTDYELTFNEDGTKIRIQAYNDNIGNQAVLFARGATGLDNVEMKGGGKTALALGFVLPFDVSEAEGYCEARHYIDDFKDVDTDFDRNTDLSELDVTPLNDIPTLYIGSSDDPLGHGSLDASELELNFKQDIIKVSVPVTNQQTVAATLYWWMDFNNDGVFADNEVKIFPDIAAGETSLDVPLEFTEADFPTDYVGENLRVGGLHSRFRITTTALIDNPDTEQDERSCGLAIDGEVEDYTFDVKGISISGTVFIDGNGMTDQVDGIGKGTLAWEDATATRTSQLYAYLNRPDGSLAGKAVVNSDGTYRIINMNHGDYTLSISYQNISENSGSLTPQLPPTWSAVGETFGDTNRYDSSLDENIDLRVGITTPTAGYDIQGVNFGVDQPPFPKNDTVVSPAYKSVEVEVLNNDNDLQGDETILPTSVVLLSSEGTPTEGQEITTDAGSFTVLADGKIRFVPVNSFHGKTASIAYAVKDEAGLLSETALLMVSVERPRMVISNPMLPSRAQKSE